MNLEIGEYRSQFTDINTPREIKGTYSVFQIAFLCYIFFFSGAKTLKITPPDISSKYLFIYSLRRTVMLPSLVYHTKLLLIPFVWQQVSKTAPNQKFWAIFLNPYFFSGAGEL